MNPLQTFIKQLKPTRHRKTPNPNLPVSSWSEQDRYHNEIVDAFVLILRTRGCSWMFQSGCSMCGYFNDSMLSKVTSDQLINQYKQAMTRYNNEPIVKIFTSGSFLDANEVPEKVQEYIFSDLTKKTKKIAVESRPEYVTETSMNTIKNQLTKTELDIGIGLETSQDFIRDFAINKGFSFEDYRNAVTLVHNNNFSVKTYILIKPPFLTEKESIEDVKQTIDHVLPCTDQHDILSFNPTSVQKNTLVEYLWRRKQYRPPWLWSIIDMLTYAAKKQKKTRLQCDITGGGKKRGAHNCFTCDSEMLSAIKEFSLTQDPTIFKDVNCDCKNQWKDQLNLESTSFGSLPDVMNP
ncbi:MAG: archaeosine biosynthesis radical SAM protein RaSEA [Candidatus Thermoplasmatota archaeon]|nr:archaeosine biosynthesis radical SAM protein RaSEA [Candidatus Thermoplasmatota archaeon]MBS3801743.1 archaeosine biosynthesis radical SAM protein RaSEA [Candidatus Thermoplasmatota archaeon]